MFAVQMTLEVNNPGERVWKEKRPKIRSKHLEVQRNEHEISKYYNIVAKKIVFKGVAPNVSRESAKKSEVINVTDIQDISASESNLKNQERVAKLQAAIDRIRENYIQRYYSKIGSNPSDEEDVGVHQNNRRLDSSSLIDDAVFSNEHLDTCKVSSTTPLVNSSETESQKRCRDKGIKCNNTCSPSEGTDSTKDEKKNQEIVQRIQKAIDRIRINYIKKLKKGNTTYSDDEETVGNPNNGQLDTSNHVEDFLPEIAGSSCV